MKKAVIITGAGSGIGRAIAVEFSKHDYFTYLLGRDKSKLEETAGLCRSGARRYSLDLSDEASIQKTSQDILSQKDTEVQILVNNAGIFDRHIFLQSDLSTWRNMFETNLFGSLSLTQKILPHFQKLKFGSVLNIASTLGVRPLPFTSSYSASKAAMINWNHCMALEFARNQIRFNCICPGIVATPIHGDADFEKMASSQPLGRVGQPEDIAQAAYFLASPQSLWTTGAVLQVDGGINL